MRRIMNFNIYRGENIKLCWDIYGWMHRNHTVTAAQCFYTYFGLDCSYPGQYKNIVSYIPI